MAEPTEKQLSVIRYIERNLPTIKFSGKTKLDAARFISENIDASKKAYRKTCSRIRYSYRSQNDYSNTENDSRESAYERYMKYIDQVSLNYVDDCGDCWGGFEPMAMAMRNHSFDFWEREIDSECY